MEKKQDIQIANEHIKRWRVSLVIKRMKIKATLSSTSLLDKEDKVLPGSDVLAL